MADDTTVTLDRGYVDSDGHHHRLVTLRCPTIGDEIEASKLCEKHELGASATSTSMAMVYRCIVKWENLPDPKLHHILALRRGDANKLISVLLELEDADAEVQMGNETSDTEFESSKSAD